MPQLLPKRPLRVAGWSVPAAFAAVIVLFTLANVISMLDRRMRQNETRATVENMLTSIELLARLGHDLDEQHRLVEAHVYEKETADMARLEVQMALVEADLAGVVAKYEPWATFPDERQAWDALKAKIDGLHGPIAHVLELSRRNHDADAHAEAVPLEARFEDVAKSAEALVVLNHVEGERTILDLQGAQRVSMRSFVLLTLAGIALSVLLAVFVTRVLRRREDGVAQMTTYLEARNRELDAFAARVAHDLRGPLAALSLAGERMAACAEDHRTAAAFRRSAARMSALIDDLLALSRVEADTSNATCDPTRVADAIAEEWRPRVEENGGALEIDVAPATVRGSEGLLRQALANLVDNAVKYRRPDAAPRVSVRGAARPGSYELVVADNGMGLSEEDAGHVFEPFHRAARSRAKPGTGLGLSIVKRIVEARGGRVRVSSALDRGTTFTIELPLSEAPQVHAGVPAGAAS